MCLGLPAVNRLSCEPARSGRVQAADGRAVEESEDILNPLAVEGAEGLHRAIAEMRREHDMGTGTERMARA